MSTQDDHNQDQEIIDRIAQDARVIEEARMLPVQGTLSIEQREWARKKAREYIERKNLDLAMVARQIGNYKVTTIEQGLNQGATDKLLRALIAFIEQHARSESANLPSGFVSTRVTERMLAVMKEVQATGTVGLIFGPAGVSKTVVCKAASAGLLAGSVHIELRNSTKSPKALLKLWSRKLGLPVGGACDDLQERIINHLEYSRRLQIIDEAHYLTDEFRSAGTPTPGSHKQSRATLNIVRDIHKQTGCGVVLVGTVDIDRAVDDATAFYGQFARLISVRYDVTAQQNDTGTPLFTIDEVRRYAASMGLKLTPGAARRLTELSCIPGYGGLGKVMTLLLIARHLAKRNDGVITEDHLKKADKSRHGLSYFRRTEQLRQQLVEGKLKIA